MVDLKQIDTFFVKERAFDNKPSRPYRQKDRFLKIAKLAMPSIAAILIALILIWPNFKKNNTITSYDLTVPKKGELEKLHIENTVFSITDSDGKISSLTADSMNETQAGSKIVQMTNPKGKIAVNTKEEFVDISSETGFYHQNDNLLILEQNVKAVHNKDTVVTTSEAQYDFVKAYGQGYQPVYAYGTWGKLWANGFAYDKNMDTLFLNGQTKIVRPDGTLYANKQTIYDKNKNIVTAIGSVILEQNGDTLRADKIVMFLTDEKQLKVQKIEAFGNVTIHTDGAIAKADKGVYKPDAHTAELEENVSIQKDGHIVYGYKAVTNLETQVSHVFSKEKNKRVSGMINGQNIRKDKNEKK